jgi:hypothetical protein
MLGVCVSVGIHRHSFDAHATRRCCHTAGNFTAVSDQNFFKHFGFLVLYVSDNISDATTYS